LASNSVITIDPIMPPTRIPIAEPVNESELVVLIELEFISLVVFVVLFVLLAYSQVELFFS
jgi:hypothetical protein